MSKKILSIDDIANFEDTAFAELDIWGATLRFGSIDAGTMITELAESEKSPLAKRLSGIRLIIHSLVDENNKRIGSMNQMEVFKRKNMKDIRRCVEVINRLNGVEKEGIDISKPLTEAGTDKKKLAKLVEDLRILADEVEAAGTDEQKLQAIIDGPETRGLEKAKNGSSEADTNASLTN